MLQYNQIMFRKHKHYILSPPSSIGEPPLSPFLAQALHTAYQSFNALPTWMLLGLGAALGAGCRYGLLRYFSTEWQGICFINLLGCFGFGLGVGLMLALPERFNTPAFKVFFLTGGMGAMTTFSSYLFNLHELLNQSPMAWQTAVLNLLLQHGLGLGLMSLGIVMTLRLSRWLSF